MMAQWTLATTQSRPPKQLDGLGWDVKMLRSGEGEERGKRRGGRGTRRLMPNGPITRGHIKPIESTTAQVTHTLLRVFVWSRVPLGKWDKGEPSKGQARRASRIGFTSGRRQGAGGEAAKLNATQQKNSSQPTSQNRSAFETPRCVVGRAAWRRAPLAVSRGCRGAYPRLGARRTRRVASGRSSGRM
jgi:hypothetical protein